MNVVRNYWLPFLSLTLAVSGATIHADGPHGFSDPTPRALTAAPFTDGEIDALLATLDSLLSKDVADAQGGDDAAADLWTFRERLQAGTLSTEQEDLVRAHLDRAAREFPSAAAAIERERELVSTLAVGKPAPDIVGKDLDGKEFRLSDYRGTVVVLAFSGEWCGACRVEYPYQRLLMEVYKDRPFTMLSVNSDKDAHAAKQAKIERGLTYRSWWDGYAEKNTHGPIATAWGVRGWPTIYVLDEAGVIRFVNLRQEDLLKSVKQLMGELASKPAANQ